MTNANDIEFAELANEVIAEFGINVGWTQSAATVWDVGESKDAANSSSVGATVFMSPMTDDRRSLANFQNRMEGDSVAYVEPSALLDSGNLFSPSIGAVLTFPGDRTSTLASFNRLFSGDDIAVYELLLRA